ncbi:MAG: hypothetical protein AAFQ79_19175 [Pseudomonadota bacterium]
MAEYFRATPISKNTHDFAEKFFEIGRNGNVTRTVKIDGRGRALANSILIMSHRSSAFADFASGSTYPCLFANRCASVAEWKVEWANEGLAAQPSTKGVFEKRFMTANPDL